MADEQKEIEEITSCENFYEEFESLEKDIAEICPALFEDGCKEIVCARCLANKLQKANYRKADKVRKETVERRQESRKVNRREI